MSTRIQFSTWVINKNSNKFQKFAYKKYGAMSREQNINRDQIIFFSNDKWYMREYSKMGKVKFMEDSL